MAVPQVQRAPLDPPPLQRVSLGCARLARVLGAGAQAREVAVDVLTTARDHQHFVAEAHAMLARTRHSVLGASGSVLASRPASGSASSATSSQPISTTASMDAADLALTQLDELAESIEAAAPSIRADLAQALTGLATDPTPLAAELVTELTGLLSWFDDDDASGLSRLWSLRAETIRHIIGAAQVDRRAGDDQFSQRAVMLSLARDFVECDAEQAHRLFGDAFRAFSARHLLLGPEEPDPRLGVGVSWWSSEPIDVPPSLRSRGDRAIRGRSSRVPDPSVDRVRLTAQAQRENAERLQAAAELGATADVDGRLLSPAARAMLLELHSELTIGRGGRRQRAEATDAETGLTLSARPGEDTRIRGEDGELVITALQLRVEHAGTDEA